ncbi:PREDICTED: uncharacterized protein LOC109586840 [Amphimedon queenslandica]|uniref:Glycosyltransferase family 92 protein n=1 Tax=Amphimedon queenslandica TaxID=400682 RepID=A0AAN0JP75_AMPQE|nr:PREDICTED: uncharacterized protein LOC109586840 [Amphimedon queenslandica]|eukprot:XP_019858623.1 PREDICTED: uncharacterized protein LOC109586840 [Amphimedon queenslandica]
MVSIGARSLSLVLLCVIVAVLLVQVILYQLVGADWFKKIYDSVSVRSNEPEGSKYSSVGYYKKAFHHPQTIDDLWILVSRDYIVRRLGYLDLRDVENVTIRLITMQDKRKAPPVALYINIHYNTMWKRPHCMPTQWDYGAIGGGYDNYENYLLKTDLLFQTQYESLSHITVSTNNDCSSESGVIPIQTIKPKEYDYNFGVCLHKGIGPDFKPKILLDYVKMHLAVGAEIITIYIQTGAEGVYDILLPYINKGTVEVLDWKLEPNITNGGSHHYGQTGVLAECLWRNTYRVKYLGMNDADEFFIPLKHKTISELMSDIDTPQVSKTPAATFGFPNFMMKGNETLPKVSKALQSGTCPQLRNEPIAIYYTRSRGCVLRGRAVQKVVFRPVAIYLPWVHCQIKFRSWEYIEEYKLPEDTGLSYHYRSHWKKYKSCSVPEYHTTVIEKYIKILTGCDI